MSDRNNRRSLAWLLLILGLIAAIILLRGNTDLKSPAETKQVLDELGIRWTGLGPPVVVLTLPG